MGKQKPTKYSSGKYDKCGGKHFNNAKHNHEQDKYDKWFQRAEETLTHIVLNTEETPVHKSQ